MVRARAERDRRRRTTGSCPKACSTTTTAIRSRSTRDLEGLDLNRNFPSGWRPGARAARRRPLSDQRARDQAVVDFIVAHKNIGAAISYHTYSGVILRPMGTESDDDMIPEDLWSIKRFSEIGAELTGYPAISDLSRLQATTRRTSSAARQDWIYEHLGALFWVVEIWAPKREAGITDYKFIDWFRDHPVEDDLKLIEWSDEHCGGQAHVDWKPFMHPQLGPVEIGGWDKMTFWRNPPPQLREREAARFPKWMTTDRAFAAQARAAAHRGARARRRHLAGARSRSPTAAGCRPT